MSKVMAFMSNFGIFYDARSPNMAMSRDPRSEFRKKIYSFPNSAFNIGKSCKISSRKALLQKLSAKNLTGGWKTPPSAFRVKIKSLRIVHSLLPP